MWLWVAFLEANRNTRTRTCGSDERLMLPPDWGDVPNLQSIRAAVPIAWRFPRFSDLIFIYVCNIFSYPRSTQTALRHIHHTTFWKTFRGIPLQELFSDSSLHSTIEKANMTEHFTNFLNSFSDIGHGASGSYLPCT